MKLDTKVQTIRYDYYSFVIRDSRIATIRPIPSTKKL